MEPRTCLGCAGTGRNVREAFTWRDPDTQKLTEYGRKVTVCHGCNGSGKFMPPDVPVILAEIRGRSGLRSNRPKSPRAYYTWRIARFHGGADVTMPVMASMEVRHDPFKPELELLAEIVARRVFGTDLAAAHRWGRALGYLGRDLPGLPDSAYPGERVADADKPQEESGELR